MNDRSTFENLYAGLPPWEIGRPQRVFVEIADSVSGTILDVGCGTGETALFFSGRGHQVTGVDFLMEPLKQANQKAQARGLNVPFLCTNALSLTEYSMVFDVVIDSGLFHVFEDDDRRRYVQVLASVLKPGGELFLLCFSDEEPGTHGPRRVSRSELETAFGSDWKIESILPARFEVRPEDQQTPPERTLSPGGPKAWFAKISKIVPFPPNQFVSWYVKTSSGYQIVVIREGERGFQPYDDPAEESEELTPLYFATEIRAKGYCDRINEIHKRTADDVARIVSESIGASSPPPEQTGE
ncbi:MAG: class I SAM-dependent methyltransferase [Planctomycetaceae bacterium]|nr:class I SAM-dependent methyltransferase [Planctomycetaceae bacterium]